MRKLAEFLSSCFDRLGKTRRGYAQEKDFTARDLSSFLRGQRIPPPTFVSDLLKDVGASQGNKVPVEEIERAQQLRLEALQATAKAKYEVEDLRAQFEIAKARREQADQRLRSLENKISSLENKIERVQRESRELERSPTLKAITASARQEAETRKKDLVRTQTEYEAQIEGLKAELVTARDGKAQAKKKCEELENALKKALPQLVTMGGIIGYQDLELPQNFKHYIDNRKERWGGVIGWSIGPLTVYALPAYLGLMFPLVFDQIALRAATLTGLIIPVWFAYGVKRLERNGLPSPAHLALVLLVTGLIFGVAAMVPRSVWPF
ncbi:hypothetical protein HCN51_10230 [Nonomuraea sp. FMUSA5-5]|uniref:Uncharacterized protein n=1 Tax=Nonomuraea composti TaxID=2720023 RepID=A0ABX1B0I0_9ACTN|nr:hypothetical protein [Nonomuraea sp. FMUSA5-5]NJP89819.1 hypothetical protein [Nonomuraea sp. FMUSA5-5]